VLGGCRPVLCVSLSSGLVRDDGSEFVLVVDLVLEARVSACARTAETVVAAATESVKIHRVIPLPHSIPRSRARGPNLRSGGVDAAERPGAREGLQGPPVSGLGPSAFLTPADAVAMGSEASTSG
jgi:hypothetical protein